jgi:imidazolonepropionase-like amidohydrolase
MEPIFELTRRNRPGMTGLLTILTAMIVALPATDGDAAQKSADPSPGAVSAAAPAPTGQSFLVHDARVFDGERVIAATDVLVRDGIIAAVGNHLRAPKGVESVDGAGRTLLPGLIDAHTHSWGSARRDALRFGVTTELDMFGDWHQIAAARRERDSTAATQLADLWSAGTLATVPHGHGTEYGFAIPTLTTPAEAPAFVAARSAEGSDYIKIILEDGSAYGQHLPSLDAATVRALVAAAHAGHKMALAHVATQHDAEVAVDAGIDGLAHVFLDRDASPGFIAAIRSRGTFVVATLAVSASVGGADSGRALAEDGRLQPWLSAAQRESLRTQFPPAWRNPALFTHALENTRLLHAAGVPILAGTDAGNPGTTHGASLHEELALLTQAGLAPTEALAAATGLTARKFGLQDRGRILVGRRADLLLVDGDPTRDITATRAILAIWKNGALVDRSLPPDAPVAAAAPAASVGGLISDFDGGAISVRFGQNWIVSTDQMAGGKSTAAISLEAGGAGGSKAAMRVRGEVDGGLPYAWAGALFMPGPKPFEAVDFSQRASLIFKVRGDKRSLSAMLFSGSANQRMPAFATFQATPEWTEVRLPLAGFGGADLAQVRALAFTAGLPAGPFTFEIDDVRIE